ncbi:MAG: hypothetical protein RR609_07085, partial [Aurantimicrobium sp.]
MPALIQGAGTDSVEFSTLEESSAPQYAYPDGLNLSPGSDLHDRLKLLVLHKARASYGVMQRRHASWRKVDKTLCAYIDPDDAEILVQQRDPRKPVSIVFPYSYAILDTLTAFMDGLFLKSPIFRYEGNSPEDVLGAALLEKVIDIHCKRNKVNLSLHTAFRDGLAYGVGAAFPMWKQNYGFKTRATPDGVYREAALLFEGNAIETVDPYKLLLDPIVGVKDVQAGEMVGFIRTLNFYDLLTKEAEAGGNIFNVRYLDRKIPMRTTVTTIDPSYREIRTGGGANADPSHTNPVDIIFMYLKIIPKDYGLGDSEMPEKWQFALAGDKVIIQAQPLNADHDMFPIALCAPTFDGYTNLPLSRLELMEGLQGVIDWLFNSHITNVRKALNDMIIYDPFMLNSDDVKDPKPGKLIRARRAAWGKDLRGSIMQFPVTDVTQSHLNDTGLIASLMHRLSGTDDATMGMLRQGGPERLTGTEFSGTQRSAMGRMEAMTRIIGSQMMQDLGYMMAMHTQQLMSQDLFVDTAGRWQEVLGAEYAAQIQGGKMRATPNDLRVDFDISVLDYNSLGSQDATLW